MTDSGQFYLDLQENPESTPLNPPQQLGNTSPPKRNTSVRLAGQSNAPSTSISTPPLTPRGNRDTFVEGSPSSPYRNNNNSSTVGARLNSIYGNGGNGETGSNQSPAAAGLPQKKKLNKEQLQYYYNKCLVGISHSINIIKAVMMRVIFWLHSLVAIAFVFFVRRDEWYFVNILGVVFMMIELFVTIIKRKGREPRWFFPCFFIYICTMIPPIWFIELARINQANAKRQNNSTESDPLEDLLSLGETLGESLGDSLLDETGSIVKKIDPQMIDIGTIAMGLEISLLLLVIMGRWFLPKGNISRSTLSQLLLVYMSLASDIVDLLSLLNETQVQESAVMTYFTLAIFSWSLFQFSLNLVVTRGRSFGSSSNTEQENQDQMDDYEDLDQGDEKKFVEVLQKYASDAKDHMTQKRRSKCLNQNCIRFDMLDSEVWSILITLIFQDGPFLALRLSAVIKFQVRTFTTMFFTFKNGIILFLQIYRLSAICSEAKHNEKDPYSHNKADALASLNSAAGFLDKFVLLSYTQNFLMKSEKKGKSSSALSSLDEVEKRLANLSPILLKSTLTKSHTYAVVLTPSFNLSVSCCQCECHLKNGVNNYA